MVASWPVAQQKAVSTLLFQHLRCANLIIMERRRCSDKLLARDSITDLSFDRGYLRGGEHHDGASTRRNLVARGVVRNRHGRRDLGCRRHLPAQQPSFARY